MSLGALALTFAALAFQDTTQVVLQPTPDFDVFEESGTKITQIAKNVWLDTGKQGRRVLVRARICLREGALEEFMCKAQTKEYESIIAADIIPSKMHAALLATGAEPGSPVVFQPKFKAPHGQQLDIQVEWKKGDATKRAKAESWMLDTRRKKAAELKWVFAGSKTATDPISKQKYYLADDGDVISVANFVGAMIDIGEESSNENAQVFFEAYTERIPPVDTEIIVIVKPIPKAKKKGSNSKSKNKGKS